MLPKFKGDSEKLLDLSEDITAHLGGTLPRDMIDFVKLAAREISELRSEVERLKSGRAG